jgi:hypothetical protein
MGNLGRGAFQVARGVADGIGQDGSLLGARRLAFLGQAFRALAGGAEQVLALGARLPGQAHSLIL